MNKPYDATARILSEMNPAEWSAYLGHPVADPGRVRLIDSNLSTIAAEVDRVMRLEDPIPWLWNIEFQAGRDLDLAARLHFYSTLLHRHHKLPVRTSLILLREAADGPELTGIQEMRYPDGEIYDWFRYDIVKIWKQPVERILAAGLTILPLAPVAQVEKAQLPDVLMAISERLDRETTRDQAKTLRDATAFLMRLRYSMDEIASFLRGVPAMLFNIRGIEETPLYQEAFQKGEARGRAEGEARGRAEGEARGRAEEARKFLIRHGTKKFGPPDEQAKARITALADLDRLHDLVDRILDVASWDELLGASNP
jgi:predicted transposase YdaD